MKHIKGNLLDFPEGINVVLHQANCKHIMGAGIAKQIKDQFPEAYESDEKANRLGQNMLGQASFARVSTKPEKWIVNVYGQDGIGGGRQTNYEGLYSGLYGTINLFLSQERFKPIFGVPKYIGCGLAGGSWKIVEAMLEQLEEEFEVEIVCVEFKK